MAGVTRQQFVSSQIISGYLDSKDAHFMKHYLGRDDYDKFLMDLFADMYYAYDAYDSFTFMVGGTTYEIGHKAATRLERAHLYVLDVHSQSDERLRLNYDTFNDTPILDTIQRFVDREKE